tara:strand:+ start:102 stop:308 length:207 start_codon:yes stop_codon:yes gene_type:complete
MKNVHRLLPMVGTLRVKDDSIIIPQEIIEELGWEERILLELEYTDDGWIIKQSKVAAVKFLGSQDDNK